MAVDSVADRIRLASTRLGDALDEVGRAFEQAALDEVPVASGALKGSVRWVRDGNTSGYLEFRWYGQLIATRIPLLSQARRNVQARARYQMRVGHKVMHPDDWYQRAWASETVQSVVRRFPEYLFRRGG